MVSYLMREQYWQMYTELKHYFYYYKHFLKFFNKINWVLSGFLTLTSLSSIAAWGVWGTHPVVWSLLICVSQIAQALFPELPYNDLLVSTKFMICSLDNLLLSIDHDWLESEYVKDYTDDEYLKRAQKYRAQYSELVSQFFSATFLPELKILHQKAESDSKNYFNHKFSIE